MFPKPKRSSIKNPNVKGTTYGGGKDVFRNKHNRGTAAKGTVKGGMKLGNSKNC